MAMVKMREFFSIIPLWPFARGRANRQVRIADGYRSRRHWSQAANHYRLALDIAPDRSPIWVQLGHALKEAGHHDAALDAYRKGAALPKDYGDAAWHLGLLARDKGQMLVAQEGFIRALKQDPGQSDVRNALLQIMGDELELDLDFYVKSNPDIVTSGIDPLLHFIEHGRYEGRPSNRSQVPRTIRHHIVKDLIVQPGSEAALMVSHAPVGRLKPHVMPYIRQLRAAGLTVLLVVVVDRPLELFDEEIAGIDGIIVRDNGGYDFGAWADGFRLCPSLFGAGLTIITNDSVIPTADTTVFRTMMDRVRSCPADVVGLTASHEYGWHLQSYFLGFKPNALSSWAFQHFIRDIKRSDNKDKVVRTYEVPFAAQMRASGLTVRALFSGSYSHNPTLFSWKELIEQGFPFIKLLILRKSFEEVAPFPDVLEELHRDWPAVTRKAGFDVDLIHSAIRAAEIATVPAGSDDGLLVDREMGERIARDHPLRVAYFGPWNYDNGLGSASRELLCTLRHTDVQLNAYPVAKPFHIHRQVCPAVETVDFAGAPDVAVVHMNPDSWHLLTDAQRDIIRSAKRRIGYWVWETDRLPPAWNHDLHSVDRIWAPSEYCAEVCRAATGMPVDVVPHPIRIPSRISLDRASVLQRFGLDPAHKVILYIFDGASYLVRKNPEALIRAFAASELAKKGWELVLKTKHLHDRPEAGKALSDLVARTAGARILEVSLHADEVTSLLAAADIYASPHCSEGFGLTVAEAMAMGKSVVATDYSGTRDFVNPEWAYPVPAELWTLEEDHGHYLSGHAWSRIDEKALASTLVEAAEAIDRKDLSKGLAAREAIDRLLSYQTVADKIVASFAALVGDPAHQAPEVAKERSAVVPPELPHIHVDLSSGTRFSEVVAREGVIPVPLAKDLSWAGEAIADGDGRDWLFLAPHDAVIAPHAVDALLQSAIHRPDVVLFYADEATVDADPLNHIRLKPEFDKTLLISSDYIGAPVFVRRKTLADIGGLDQARGTAVLYDMVLRVAEAGGTIGRIPEVLIGHKGRRPCAQLEARKTALMAQPGLQDIDLLEGSLPSLLLQRRRFQPGHTPAVSLIIPTRRSRRQGAAQTYVENLLHGIAQAHWPMDRLTVIVGDDVTGEPDWARRDWPFTLRRIETPRPPDEPFNYAAKMNHLWCMAQDEHIIFMNDDARPETPDWLTALLTFSCDESVGGVGARLYYENGSIQHAGMFPALRTVVHAWLEWPATAPTYQDWAVTQREWSMVTGAIFATRRSVLDRLNGFDEKFSLEFNDVDLCLRIRNLGYRIVYNPDAEFTHAEKASRGERPPPGQEVALFLSRWAEWLKVDPSSHPALATNRLDPVPAPQGDTWYS
jgi:O-antigen biosynthesis protein